MNGPLLRPRYDRKVAGVCAAFARAYGWDLTVTRIVTLVLAIFTGGGFLAYIICWIVIPEDPLGVPPYAGYPQAYPTGYPPQPPANYAGYQPPHANPSEPPTA